MAILGAVAVGWCVMRFIGLEKVPLGADTDEMLTGLHVECLAQTGASADGVRWPLFPEGLGGGLYSPTYLYTLFAWTRIFGISIASLRALSAMFSVIAIVGLGLLARRVAGPRAGLLAMVAASLSPWSFQVARLAVDAPMAPALVVWGVYFFLRSPRVASALAGGVLLALGAYTYPPVRVLVPLLTILLLVIERRRLSAARLTAFLGAMAVVATPLMVRVLNGAVMGRAKALSIFSDDYVRDHSGPFRTWVFIPKQALENLFEHLRPSFLFFSGDANIRHSTQVMGELGWLDILALACVFITLAVADLSCVRVARVRRTVSIAGRLVAGCAIIAAWLRDASRGALLGGAAARVSIDGGMAGGRVVQRRGAVGGLVALVARAGRGGGAGARSDGPLRPLLLHVYPKKSYEEWSGPLRKAAESRDPARFAAVARPGLTRLVTATS